MNTGVENSRERLRRVLDKQITWFALFKFVSGWNSGWAEEYVLTPEVLAIIGATPPWYDYRPAMWQSGIAWWTDASMMFKPARRAWATIVVNVAASTLARFVLALGARAGGRVAAAHASTAGLMAAPHVAAVVNGVIVVFDVYLLADAVWSMTNARGKLVDALTESLYNVNR